jgi:hypothetical protein
MLGACAQILGGVEGSGPTSSSSGHGSGGAAASTSAAGDGGDIGSGGDGSTTGATGGAGPGSGGAGPGSGGGGTVPTCDAYCNTMATNCAGNDLEYLDFGTCKAICANFNKGMPGDTAGDSLACRAHYADLAAQDHAKNCQRAGLTGEGPCTDACTGFCNSAFALCAPLEIFPFESVTDCTMKCGSYPYTLDANNGDMGPGDVGAVSGASLNCRIYHLEAAYNPTQQPQAAMGHCYHVGPMSPTCM